MKKIICHLFGHKQNKGWWGDGLYGKVIETKKDGTGRRHAHISLTCDRCGETYVAARFHPTPSSPTHNIGD